MAKIEKSYYSFEETSAGTIIDSVGVNNGTNDGVPTGATGKKDLAYNYSSNASIYMQSTDRITTLNAAISFWWNPDTMTAGQYLFATNPGNVGSVRARTVGSNDLAYEIGGSTR